MPIPEGATTRKPSNTLLQTGLVGTVLVALCCFTPILVIVLGIMGLGVVVPYLDFVLLPALAVFVGIVFYALLRRPRTAACGMSEKSPENGNKKNLGTRAVALGRKKNGEARFVRSMVKWGSRWSQKRFDT